MYQLFAFIAPKLQFDLVAYSLWPRLVAFSIRDCQLITQGDISAVVELYWGGKEKT